METASALNDPMFQLLVQAAINGERCPQSKPFGPMDTGAFVRLVELGLIRSEVSGRNYRQVFVLAGRHKSRCTAPNPDGHEPWKINGVGIGNSRERRLGSERRQQPSAPRSITDTKNSPAQDGG